MSNVGCGDAQQQNEQKQELPDLTGTSDASALAIRQLPDRPCRPIRAPGCGRQGLVTLSASISTRTGATILILNSGIRAFLSPDVFLDDGKSGEKC